MREKQIILTSYIKRLRNSAPQQGSANSDFANGEGAVPLSQELQEALDDFVQRYPIDDGARSFLAGSPADVVARVLKDFRPKSEGDSDYSALVMTYVKRCRADQRVALVHDVHHAPAQHNARSPPSQTDCSNFFQRYPVDERALDYFASSPSEVQWKVLEEFKPRVEGEADYSGLLTSFCKRWRTNISGVASQPFPAPAFGPVGGKAFGAKGLSKGFVGGTPAQSMTGMLQPGGPRPADFLAFRNRFPMDDRAFSYLTESSPEVADRVLATFVPPRFDDTDYSAPITSYVKQCRKQFPSPVAAFSPVGAYHGPVGGFAGGVGASRFAREPLVAPVRQQFSSFNSGPPRHAGSQSLELQQFLTRYPCDDRATDYLTTQSPEVIDRVVREFKAKREGESDYSAIVMSFTKRCKDFALIDGGKGGGGFGGGVGAGADAELRKFLNRYPCDERATDFLSTQPPDVIYRVVNEFQAKREGDSDYSAIVMSFTKRCKDSSRVGGGFGGGGGAAYEPPWKRARPTYH